MKTTMQLLAKEKIISVSDLQKNPSKALEGDIVRITKNGKEIGVFLSKNEFQDMVEEAASLKPSFQKELKTLLKKAKTSPSIPLTEIL